MNPQTFGLRIASFIFGIMSLAQLCRLAIRPEVLVAGHAVPLWPSAIAVVVLGGLCFWMWGLAQSAGTRPSGPRNMPG
jgi:hypothetical protein